eukprot:1481511-Pleurochrysis_carterae.AAC.1
MKALDRAHTADRNWPFENARHALVLRRSAAIAKAEVMTRLPTASGAGIGAHDRVSVGPSDAAPHRISARASIKRYVGLALRGRRAVERERSVACDRCTSGCVR